jgi:hypothetical protein
MDADFSTLFDGVMQVYPEVSNKVDRLGYTKGSFYGDEGEWTKGRHIKGPLTTWSTQPKAKRQTVGCV